MTKKELIKEWQILKKSIRNEKINIMDLIPYWDGIIEKLKKETNGK